VRLVFFGTGRFAVPCLQALADRACDIARVITQPDRPQGRGRQTAPPPIKIAAEALGLSVDQPAAIRTPEFLAALRTLRPAMQIVVAYGRILPPDVLAVPPLGTINVHASLLPRYRGAAPIQWAIANGESETGVTTMMLDAGLDTGPVLLRAREPIHPTDTSVDIETRLAALGADLLIETLRKIEQGQAVPQPQDESQATLARIISKEDGVVDWRMPAQQIENRLRAFTPWPGLTTRMGTTRIKLLAARPLSAPAAHAPAGEVLAITPEGLQVVCGEQTTLQVSRLQPESGRAMDAWAFAQGRRLAAGMRFEG
jgi:methionyl-tRNA formyltransferase